jgi:hypothetical protein
MISIGAEVCDYVEVGGKPPLGSQECIEFDVWIFTAVRNVGY